MSEIKIEKAKPLVNGKYYPLWQQFVDRKSEWIGGRLIDSGDPMDRALGLHDDGDPGTEIVDITLEPNGEDSAFFRVVGKDFTCGFDVQSGGIFAGDSKIEGALQFSGYGGHSWCITKPTAILETSKS